MAGAGSTTPGWDRAQEWKAVLILSLAFGLVGLDRFILPPLFPAMMQDLRLDYQDLGDLVGVLGLAWGVSAFLLGNFADRYGRRRVLVPAIVLFSLLSGLSGMATGFASLLIIRAVMGLGEGPVASIGNAASIEASHPRRRGMNNGLFQCAAPLLGAGLGPILATQLLRITSWRHVFLIVGVPGLIVAACIAIIVREPAGLPARGRTSGPRRAPLAALFRSRNVAVAAAALICAMTGQYVLQTMMPNYLIDFIKLSTAQMGFVTSAMGFGGALGMAGLLAASDFIGRRAVAVGAFALAAVFLGLLIHARAHPVEIFVLLSLIAIFNIGVLAILAGPIGAEAAPTGLVASAIGVIVGAGEIFGGGVAPPLAGAVAQRFGIQFTPYLALAALIAGLALSLLLRETAPRRVSRRGGALSDLDHAPLLD